MKYLVAFDGSESSQQALHKAISLAKNTQGELTLLTIIEPLQSISPPFIATGEPALDWQNDSDQQWQEGLQKILDQQHDKLQKMGESLLNTALEECQKAGVKANTVVGIGIPRDEILHITEAQKPDILIIGSRGFGAIKRLLLGSVSDFLVHHVSCSVLVVRPKETN